MAQKATLQGITKAVTTLDFNYSNMMILASSADNSTKLWEMETKRLCHTFTGHLSKIYASRFVGTNFVASGSHDRTLKIFDITKGYCVKTIFTLSSCNDLAPIDKEGAVLASGHLDNNIRIWDCRSGELVKELAGIHYGQITSIEVSPSNTFLI